MYALKHEVVSVGLVAYSQTGKDTLIKDLKEKKLKLNLPKDNIDEKEQKWVVYAKLEDDWRDLFHIFKSDSTIKRYAFADALKNETHHWLRFVDCPVNAFENLKNTLIVPHPTIPYLMKTIRGWYIDYGQEARMKDPLVWAKIVNSSIEQEKFSECKEGLIDIISDFRFDNELLDRTYSLGNGIVIKQPTTEITTIRLHRAAVPVAATLPDRRFDSEHNLDTFQTKYLFITPGEGEEKIAMERFPQYKNYIPIFIVTDSS